MEAQEANKIIAEFMGWSNAGDYHVARKVLPFNSLDALVPVWGKLKKRLGKESKELNHLENCL